MSSTEYIGLYDSTIKHVKGIGNTSICGQITRKNSGAATTLERHLSNRSLCKRCEVLNRSSREQFPPPLKPTSKNMKQLALRFDVHRGLHQNPDPADCPRCGLRYSDLKTGLTFQSVKDLLWVESEDTELWRHKRRGSVLGLWHEIKQSMWADHLEMCGDPVAQEEYLEDFEY